MALTLESVIRYVPEYSGERKHHEAGENENPVTFHIKVMGAVAFRAFAAKLARAVEEDANTDQATVLYRDVVAEHVVKIENLSMDGVPIETGAVLYDHPAMPIGLVVELERTIMEMNRLSKDEAKN
jgi:hypothetical protein